MEHLVELSRVAASCIYVSVKDQKSYIQLEVSGDDNNFLYFDKKLWRWYDRKCDSENIAIVHSRIQTLFPSSNLVLHLHLDKIKGSSFQKLLLHPSFSDWKTLSVEGEKVGTEELNLIMNMASKERNIMINVELMPNNFNHEKAFQFREIEYHGADWIRVEDLFALRNSTSVTMSLKQFNSDNLSKFLCYWINCDYSMFQRLTIYIENPEEFLPNKSFDDLSCLFIRGFQEFLMLSNSTKNLEFPIAVVSLIDSTFKLTTVPPDGEYAREYRILKTLKKRKHLEDVMKTINDPSYQDSVEELRRLTKELEQMGVQLISGKAFL